MSVALSADGNTALIGDPGNNAGVGAAWAFTRSGQAWTQQGPKLTGSGEIGEGFFGMDVALSADGNTALVGGPRDNGEVGAAWAFTRSGQTWTQQGSKLTGSGAIGAGLFGWSVALSADGNTALIGGPADNQGVGALTGVGAAWVFTRSGQTWAQQGPKLTGAWRPARQVRPERRAVRGWEHGADRRAGRQRERWAGDGCRGGVGVHPLGADLGPARAEADRRGRDRCRRLRHRRRAVDGREHGAGRRSAR